jgi:cytoskeletal protein RodZ
MTSNDIHKGKRGLSPSRVIVAVLAVVLIEFCAWSMVQYARGEDPLAFMGGTSSPAFQTVDEASSAEKTDVAASASGLTDSGDVSGSTAVDDAGTSDSAASDSAASQPVAESTASTQTTVSVTSTSSSDESGGSSSSTGSESVGTPSTTEKASTLSITVRIDGSAAGAGSGSATVTLDAGSTAYDALVATGASINAKNYATGIYVASINGLAEKDHGASSGWVYAVNGVEPGTACSNYELSDGDTLTWTYVNVEG